MGRTAGAINAVKAESEIEFSLSGEGVEGPTSADASGPEEETDQGPSAPSHSMAEESGLDGSLLEQPSLPDAGASGGTEEQEAGSEAEADGESSADEEELTDDQSEDDTAAEQVVGTFDELKKALENAKVTQIRLSNNIQLTGGVTVHPGRQELVIDGASLERPDRVYTLTEHYSSAAGDTISLQSNQGLKQITVRNLNIRGYNHYGTIYVSDVVKDATILYENISYYGPQMIFNRYGTAHIKDSEIDITGQGCPTAPGEVGEVTGVILEGTVRMEQLQNNDNEFFYMELGSGAVELRPGADVTVQAYAAAGFTYVAASQRTTLSIGEDAVLRYSGSSRFWDGTSLSGVVLEAGAQLYVDITGSLANEGVLYVRGDVEVRENAVMHLRMLGGGTNAALRVQGGSISLQDPRSVLLYAPNGRCIHYNNQNSLYMEAQQINYWTSAPAMSLDALPLRSWSKADKSNFWIEGQMNLGNWAEISSNYEQGDPGEEPSVSGASMVNARLLALGRATVDGWYDLLPGAGSVIEGETSHPQSLARAFLGEEQERVPLGEVSHTETGTFFEIPLEFRLPDRAQVTVETVGYYLWASSTFAVHQPDLYLVPQSQHLNFLPTPLAAAAQLVQREEPSWSLSVYDSRPEGAAWKLWAVVRAPLRPENTRYAALAHALVYIDRDGAEWDLAEDTLIAQGISTGTIQETAVMWPEGQGILVRLPPGAAYAGTPYTATITWRLEDVP